MFKQMAVFVLAIVTLVTISLPLAQAQFPGGAPYYSYYYPIYPTYTPAPVYYGYPLSFGGYTLYGTRGYTSFGSVTYPNGGGLIYSSSPWNVSVYIVPPRRR